jgi:hypothetical protein
MTPSDELQRKFRAKGLASKSDVDTISILWTGWDLNPGPPAI